MVKTNRILILTLIILSGLAISLGYHYYFGVVKNLPYPYTTFLFWPDARLSDYYDVIRDSQTLNPYLEFKSAQYPFLIILGYLFSKIPNGTYNFFAGLICTSFLFFSFYFLRGKTWYTNLFPVIIITSLNYPILIALDRGNFESLLFVFLLVFLFFYTQKKYSLSALALALAVSMKVYPAILLILFIADKKYRAVFTCILATILITFGSLLCFKGGFMLNLEFLLRGANVSSNLIFDWFTTLDVGLVQRGVSLLTLFKIFYAETGLLPVFIVNDFMTFYLILISILSVGVISYAVFIEKELWKRMALLIFAMLLFPTLSADYKLLHVFIPLFLFLNKEEKSKFDILYLLLFGLLLIPKDYYYFLTVYSDTAGSHDISIAVVINILAMIIMSFVIMVSGLRKRIFDNRSRRPA